MKKFSRSVLALIAVVLAACGGGDEASVGTDGQPALLASAAAATTAEGSSLVEFTVTLSDVPDLGSASFTGSGAFDYESGNSTMTFGYGDLFDQLAETSGEPIPAGFGEDMEIRTVGGDTYMKAPMFGAMFGGAGSDWLRLPATTGNPGETGLAPVAAGTDDPAALLDLLGGGTPERVGTEEVRGVATTHYTGTFDADAALEQIPEGQRAEAEAAFDQLAGASFPIDVWVDDEDRVRRFQMDMNAASLGVFGGNGVGSMVMQMDFFDFGADVDVTAPDGYTNFEDLGFLNLEGFGN